MDRLLILAIVIVIAGALSGGVYSVSGTGNGTALIVNRLSGNTWLCGLSCSPIRFNNSN